VIRFWLPVFLWGALMFTASTDIGSSTHTRQVLAPLLRWLVPGIPAARIDRINFMVRKGAHVTEYTIFTILLWRAVTHPRKGEVRGWSWGGALMVVGLTALFAVGDEFHQAFVPSRTSSPRDVMIDTCGALLGITLMGVLHCFRRKEPVAS